MINKWGNILRITKYKWIQLGIIISLYRNEFRISVDKNYSYVKLSNLYSHCISKETTMQKHKDGHLYYAGDYNFRYELFEVYAIQSYLIQF